MSRLTRKALVLFLALSLVNLHASALTLTTASSRYSLTAPLTEWLTLASWHTTRYFRSLFRPQGSPNLDTLRGSNPNLPDPPGGTNITPPSGYDDPQATGGPLINDIYYSGLSQAANDTGRAGSKPLQSADPTAGDCSTGAFSYNHDSHNYNFTAPVLSLPGRTGLNLSLGLAYNSRVWGKTPTGAGGSGTVFFNPDKGSPAPGWRIGFGAIQGASSVTAIGPYANSATGKNSFLYIAPDGTRHDIAYNLATGLYESYDASYLDFNPTTKILRTTGGMKITFGDSSTANGDYQFLPTQIKDRNGNFITVTYKTLSNNDRVIDYVTDTLGRRIDFYYESNRLREIRQDRNGVIFKHVIIDYQPVTVNVGFYSGTTVDPANISGQQVYLPTRITYPTGANLRFYYTSFAQAWLVEKWAPSVQGQGAARRVAYTRFNLPSAGQASYPANSLSSTLSGPDNLTDCPGFSWRVEQAENWNQGEEKIIQYGYNSQYNYHWITDGDQNLRIYVAPLSRSLVTMGGDNALKEEKVTYTQDSGVPYPSNPRVTETKVIDYSIQVTRRATIGYTQQNGVWLPNARDEYDQSTTNVYRRAETTYTSYPAQRIIGLPAQISVYAGPGTTLVSRVTYSYDETGAFTDSNGQTAPYFIDETAAQVVQHDNTNYGGSFTQRGNLTSVTQSGVTNGAVTNSRVTSRVAYDTNGNARSTTDGAGNRAQMLYTDNFSNKPGTVGQTQAYPYTAADPTGFRSGKQYDYWQGNLLKSFILRAGSSVEEQVVTSSYDFADRVLQTNRPDGGYVKTGYWDNLLYATTFQKTDTVGGADQLGFSFKLSDGAGRLIRQGSDHPNAIAGKYSGQKFVYDLNGRQSDVSNVTAINSDWTPIDEDASTGWLFKNFAYDQLGKVKTFTDVDGTTIQRDYLGCGCAGGATVTTTDQRGSRVESSTDFLGRLSQSSEVGPDVDSNGKYSNVIYYYDVLDRITTIEVNNAGWSYAQKQYRNFVYDEYGRVQSETTPEAGTVTYT